ncbi:MAG: hypothetical protein HYT80_11930 [Euryarchaeota archaeon]|nr:hypothetical protein [Euryarchaeota archaeon]
MRDLVEAVVREQNNEALLRALGEGRVELHEADDRFALRSKGLGRALPDWAALGPPASAGEDWGEIVKGTWRLSLPAAVRIGAPAEGVVLRDQASQRFLYGRGVQPNDIQAIRTRRGAGERVFVCDRHGDVLGLAFLEAGPNGLGLRPLLDLGWYLREGG